MSPALTVVTVSQMFVCLQTDQTVHSKYVQFFVYRLYFNKAVKVCFFTNVMSSLSEFNTVVFAVDNKASY